MTKQERSSLLRMAGNIASGLAVAMKDSSVLPCQRCGGKANVKDLAALSVSIALEIAADERLKVTE